MITQAGVWKWLAAALISVWSGLTAVMQLLILLMVIDFLTGVLCAIRRGDISSHISFLGLIKKWAILIVVGTTFLLQRSLLDARGIHIAIDLAQTVALAYIWNEGISILENCACMGAPIPVVLTKALKRAPKMRSRDKV